MYQSSSIVMHTSILLALAAGLSAPGATKRPIVVTGPTTDVITRDVSYRDLNLASRRDQRRFTIRVSETVNEVCDSLSPNRAGPHPDGLPHRSVAQRPPADRAGGAARPDPNCRHRPVRHGIRCHHADVRQIRRIGVFDRALARRGRGYASGGNARRSHQASLGTARHVPSPRWWIASRTCAALFVSTARACARGSAARVRARARRGH